MTASPLLAEVIRGPAFPADKLELAKVGLRRAIAGRNDELTGILFRAATQSVYGKDSPYARQPEYATVEPITRDDCVKLHQLAYAPNRFILVLYGDFKAAAMKKVVQGAFGDWARSNAPTPPLPPVPSTTERRVVFAPKDDVTQSGIVLAHPGFLASDVSLVELHQWLARVRDDASRLRDPQGARDGRGDAGGAGVRECDGQPPEGHRRDRRHVNERR